MQPAPASLHRTTVRVALVVLAIVAVLAVAELTPERFNAFTRDHSLISTFMTEAILLVGVYLVIDEMIQRRGPEVCPDCWCATPAATLPALGPAERLSRECSR